MESGGIMAKHKDIYLTKSSKTEIVVRSYHCTSMLVPKCNGYLTITNKRVIFQGSSKDESLLNRIISRIVFLAHSSDLPLKALGLPSSAYKTDSVNRTVTEVDISTVSGVASHYGTKTNIIMLLIGLAMFILPVAMYISSWDTITAFHMFWGQIRVQLWILTGIPTILITIIGALLVLNCRRATFFLKIFSSQASGAPIAIGGGVGNFGGGGSLYSLVGEPTAQTDKMMSEIGAIISDIRELGDNAIELWDEKKSGTGSVKKQATSSSAGSSAAKAPAPKDKGVEDYLKDAAKRLK